MSQIKKQNEGLTVSAYSGEGAILLAFDLTKRKTNDLAGFSIRCTRPANYKPANKRRYWLRNFLSFTEPVTRDSSDFQKRPIRSDQNPFQMFHWTHYPSAGPGRYTYEVYPAYFDGNSILHGSKVTIHADLKLESIQNLEIGFTRGYISSQAYVKKFGDKDIRPNNNSVNFDTSSYLKKYKWLGRRGRELIFDFLNECQKDKFTLLDVLVYDFDEPDIIRILAKMGSRVRLFQDNSSSHIEEDARELKAKKILEKAGVEIRTGKFSGLAHNKVLIQKKNGIPTKVLTGSANFSVRGLYVQSNNILVFNDPIVADLYETMFNESFFNASDFRKTDISKYWWVHTPQPNTKFEFSFAPHKKPPFTIDDVSGSIEDAKKSVLFSVMTALGSGKIIDNLKNIHERNGIFSIGTFENKGGITHFEENDDNSDIAFFSYLKKHVPKPFQKEWKGGRGHTIHHKFVVCDFNHKKPVVFCGSSNLAAGGEYKNGDNLIAIYDRDVVTCYAIEAIRLFDHFKFRSIQSKSTISKPMKLKEKDEDWYSRYYDKNNIKYMERKNLQLS